MRGFDFESSLTPIEFQRLCAELLEAEGAKNVRGHGVGADQGSDFLADITESSVLGIRSRTYLVQCKRWSTPNSVGHTQVSDALTSLSIHGADALLIISTAGFSGTAVTKLNAFTHERADPMAAIYWDAADLRKRLWKHPRITAKYFGRDPALASEPQSAAFTATSHEMGIGLPRAYASIALEELALDADLAARLKNAAALLAGHSRNVLLLQGGVGSGKTSIACALARQLAGGLSNVLFYPSYCYTELFGFRHREDEVFLERLKQLVTADCLILDDFGEYLLDEAETQVFALECLCDVVVHRQKLRRPTLLTLYHDRERIGAQARKFVDALAPVELLVDLGEVDHRPRVRIVSNGRGHARYLGRGWLEEKFENVERGLAEALRICRMPDEQYLGWRRTLLDLHGEQVVDKEDALAAILASEAAAVRKYREFVESLGFQSILFREDGTFYVT